VAGLALGFKLLNSKIRVTGAIVCDSIEYFQTEIDQLYSDLGVTYKAKDLIDIVDGWKGPGYDKNTQQELDLVVSIAKQTGIILDSCYTLKAAKCMLEHNKFENKNVLFIHSGGLFGLYSKLDNLPVNILSF